MKKPLIIGLSAAAIIAGVLSLVRIDGSMPAPANVVTEAAATESEAAPVIIRMAQLATVQPYMLDYERGPRIIQVPQQGERGQDRGNVRTVSRPAPRASVERRPEPAVVEEDDDDEDVVVAPPMRPRAATPKPRVAAPTPPQPPAAITPRWKLRGETPSTPPPSGPRRAVLSAPPSNTAGPTPLRPTPNFDNKGADRGEKFTSPRAPAPPAAVVSETQPPLGYSPPAMPEQPSDNVPAEDVPSAAPAPDDGTTTN